MAPLRPGSDSSADILPPGMLGAALSPVLPRIQKVSPLPAGKCDAFQSEVVALEPALRVWLAREHPALRIELDDIIQESYCRFIRAQAKGPIRCARTYLFGIARHVALNLHRRQKKNCHVPLNEVPEESTMLIEEEDVVQTITHKQELALTAEAIRMLPDRCREIVTLHTVEGLTYREIARKLGLAEETVRVQMARAVRKCTAFLRGCDGRKL